MTNEIPTPRTDAAIVGASWIMASHSSGDFVPESVAKELERELIATHARLAELERIAEALLGQSICERIQAIFDLKQWKQNK